MEDIPTHFPFAEIPIVEDFNVHQLHWLSFSFTDQGNEEAYKFALINNLEQTVQHPTRIFGRLGDTYNTLDLFLTSHHLAYSVKPYSSMSSSDHNLIFVLCSLAPIQPLDPPKTRCFWHHASARWEDWGCTFPDLLLNDYRFRVRDSSVHAQRITDMIVSGMETYIPRTFFLMLKSRGSITLVLVL